MNKNNTSVVTSVLVLVVVAVLGYVLYKTSPQNGTGVRSTANIMQNNDFSNHHGGSSVSVNTAELDALVGKPMPAISLQDKDGKVYTQANFIGKNTVLFFNEGLMCYPACWNQIAAFGADKRFNSADTQAISVVVDSARDWQRAISQMPELAKAVTMFDANAAASRQFGLLTTASSMHRGALPGHTYVLIDAKGIVRFVLDDPNMAIANDNLMAKIAELK